MWSIEFFWFAIHTLFPINIPRNELIIKILFCMDSPNAIVYKDHLSDILESLVSHHPGPKDDQDLHSWQHFNLPQ